VKSSTTGAYGLGCTAAAGYAAFLGFFLSPPSKKPALKPPNPDDAFLGLAATAAAAAWAGYAVGYGVIS